MLSRATASRGTLRKFGTLCVQRGDKGDGQPLLRHSAHILPMYCYAPCTTRHHLPWDLRITIAAPRPKQVRISIFLQERQHDGNLGDTSKTQSDTEQTTGFSTRGLILSIKVGNLVIVPPTTQMGWSECSVSTISNTIKVGIATDDYT